MLPHARVLAGHQPARSTEVPASTDPEFTSTDFRRQRMARRAVTDEGLLVASVDQRDPERTRETGLSLEAAMVPDVYERYQRDWQTPPPFYPQHQPPMDSPATHLSNPDLGQHQPAHLWRPASNSKMPMNPARTL